MAAEHLFERSHQRRPLLELRRVMRPPLSAQAAEVAEIEAQEAEAFASTQVHDAALLIIDFDLELVELLPQALFHRSDQPVMSRMSVDQDYQIVSEPRIFDGGEPALARNLLCPLQHSIHLIKVEVAEERRDDTALRD